MRASAVFRIKAKLLGWRWGTTQDLLLHRGEPLVRGSLTTGFTMSADAVG
jgi:hypothetical protein